ncbi:MAG: integrin alpha [Planctomycetota bacterium]
MPPTTTVRSCFRPPCAGLRTLALLALLPAATAAQAGGAHHVYTWEGDAPGDRLGAAVGAAGDVDGDGFADVIAGAPHADGAVPSSGAARVYSGATGVVLLALEGPPEGGWFGAAVDGAGDLDGDGLPDLVIGAPLAGSAAGCAQVRSGHDGTPLWSWTGDLPGDRFGEAVAGAGDVDADGVPDLVIGAPHAAAPATLAGRVRVLSGGDGTVLHTFEGAWGDLLGAAVSSAGDVDLDGRADVLVGAPLQDAGAFNAGAAYVFSGSDGATLHAFLGAQPGDQLGDRVAHAGDVDADGWSDLLLGSPGADAAGIDSGAAEVRSGADGALLLYLTGGAGSEYLAAVAPAGDADADGYADVAIGAASSAAAAAEAGSVWIVSGATGGELAALHGHEGFDWFGASLAGLGDTNGDGRFDLAVGAPGHDDDAAKAGKAHVLSGVALTLTSDVHAVSVSAGGGAQLSLLAGTARAGLPYYLLGSAAGTAPGLAIGGLVLPLAFEPLYLPLTAQNPVAGTLDGSGHASVTLALESGSSPALAGLTLHHAYLVLDAGVPVLASNAVPVTLTE